MMSSTLQPKSLVSNDRCTTQKATKPLVTGCCHAVAGMYIASNFLRPIRLSIALAAAPIFNTFLDKVQTRTGVSRAAAFGILLAMIAVGSCIVIFGTIALLGGFPSAGTGA